MESGHISPKTGEHMVRVEILQFGLSLQRKQRWEVHSNDLTAWQDE